MSDERQDTVTEAELSAIDALECIVQMAPGVALETMKRLARAYRRACQERDLGLLTDDLVGPAVAKAEQDAYRRGRREAIEEAAEWLVDRARSLEDECDEECDGQDADRFLDLAKSYRETSKAMLAELSAKGPARGQ